jgi:hypothetical protein
LVPTCHPYFWASGTLTAIWSSASFARVPVAARAPYPSASAGRSSVAFTHCFSPLMTTWSFQTPAAARTPGIFAASRSTAGS